MIAPREVDMSDVTTSSRRDRHESGVHLLEEIEGIPMQEMDLDSRTGGVDIG